jgi:hypothetical protein
MMSIRWTAMPIAAMLAFGVALAQGGPGRGAGAGPGPGSNASAPGAGPGAGMRGGRAMGGRSGADFTPGWSMMTPAERGEHQARMRSMKTYEQCKAYQTQHHEQMAARAKERGGKPLAQPRRDACAALKP